MDWKEKILQLWNSRLKELNFNKSPTDFQSKIILWIVLLRTQVHGWATATLEIATHPLSLLV